MTENESHDVSVVGQGDHPKIAEPLLLSYQVALAYSFSRSLRSLWFSTMPADEKYSSIISPLPVHRSCPKFLFPRAFGRHTNFHNAAGVQGGAQR